jgi:phosphoglycerate dehydrogenase-like enzyme
MSRPFNVGLTADFASGEVRLFDKASLEELRKTGIVCRFLERHEPVLAAHQIQDLDALICLTPRVTVDSFGKSGRLLAVLRFGVGYDTVDVGACTEAGVALFITSGAVNYSVAEAILGWMLALGHHSFQKDRLTREGKWPEKNRWMGSELRRKTIGLIGLGGIGGALTELLKPFQTTELLAFDPYVAPERAAAFNTRLTDLKELLRTSDYVIVTCPLNEQTRGLLGANELALMKPQAYLVNAARGGIVDESALEAALKSRQIGGAAVDVFATEPAIQHPFFALDNILLAPHAIAWTHELFQEISLMCCQQAVALSKGNIPAGLINHEVRERPNFLAKLRPTRSHD